MQPAVRKRAVPAIKAELLKPGEPDMTNHMF
jgi:hypothetical protein